MGGERKEGNKQTGTRRKWRQEGNGERNEGRKPTHWGKEGMNETNEQKGRKETNAGK